MIYYFIWRAPHPKYPKAQPSIFFHLRENQHFEKNFFKTWCVCLMGPLKWFVIWCLNKEPKIPCSSNIFFWENFFCKWVSWVALRTIWQYITSSVLLSFFMHQKYNQLKPDEVRLKQWFGKNCDIAHLLDKDN